MEKQKQVISNNLDILSKMILNKLTKISKNLLKRYIQESLGYAKNKSKIYIGNLIQK